MLAASMPYSEKVMGKLLLKQDHNTAVRPLERKNVVENNLNFLNSSKEAKHQAT
jgi:hypothetical protein